MSLNYYAIQIKQKEESRNTGGVTGAVYIKYFRSGGGWASFICLVISCLVTQAFISSTDYWLSVWINAEQIRPTLNSSSHNSLRWQDQLDTRTGIYVFFVLIGGVFVFSAISSSHFFFLCLFSAVKLHNQMFRSVIRSPLHFFEQNPVGIGYF